MNPGIRISPLQSANGFPRGRMSGERSGQCLVLKYGKLSLKADEAQVGQLHEDVERKREYYHIIIFPEKTKLYIKKEEDK